MKHKENKIFQILNILLLVGAMACLVYYMHIGGGIWMKGVTSSWFVVLGCVNLIWGRDCRGRERVFLWLVALGLIFGMCADVLLGIHFILGVAFFATGHILYLAAFYTLERPRKTDFLFILPVALVSLYLVAGTSVIQIDDPMLEKVLVGYALVISCMLGKAVSNWTLDRGLFRTLVFVGSAMFWFSDVMLAFNMFGSGGRVASLLCGYTYWPGQSILAHALFHFVCLCRKKD